MEHCSAVHPLQVCSKGEQFHKCQCRAVKDSPLLCFTDCFTSFSPFLGGEILLTLSIFSNVSGELGLLVIIEVDHEIVMFIATWEASAFPLTHSSMVT